MKITSIKQQVKDTERVSVFVDEKYSFSLSLGELVEQKLKKGQELSEGEVKRLKKVSEDGKLKARTLNWVLMRPHSEREFKDYLRRKKADKDLIENWTAEFRDRKYLDDKAFAVWFSENRARKNKSNRSIVSELFSKGINRELINEILGGDEKDELTRLRELIAKKKKAARYKNDTEKLARYLVQQGFSWSLVKEQLLASHPEESS
jgi:regulatory protein